MHTEWRGLWRWQPIWYSVPDDATVRLGSYTHNSGHATYCSRKPLSTRERTRAKSLRSGYWEARAHQYLDGA
jgi:hypothetical protein